MSGQAPDPDERLDAIAASWDANAEAWTAAVREGRIASRRAGTDAAVVAAVSRQPANRLLDVGCGEGWLARALADRGWRVTGVDACTPLIARARALGGADFETMSYERLAADPGVVSGPFDVIVLNFALLSKDVATVLRALAHRLRPDGTLVLQTVHPWTAAGDGRYADGWRVERFESFGDAFSAPMPWYFRTLGSWIDELNAAGLALRRLEEPADPSTGRPLSLLLTATPSG